MRNPRTAWVQGERVPLSQVEKVIHPRYLSLVEWERLKDLMMAGLSIRQVAPRWAAHFRRSVAS